MRQLLMCAAALTLLTAATSAAQAEIEYPWCAEMALGRSGPVESCGFTSEAQCLNYVNGIGGFCQRNLRYKEPPRPPRRHRYER